MSFSSVKELLRYAKAEGLPLHEAVLCHDLPESQLTREESRAQMARLWQTMKEASRSYCADDRSRSGLTGGDSAKLAAAAEAGRLLGGDYFNAVLAEALKAAECNACMKRIVAAPTAGSCGVLPAVLLPLHALGQADDTAIEQALYVAAGFGQVIAARASVSGAEGGCQAEVGTASGMAAAALVYLKGGTGEQCAHACAIALSNLMGLVCDPVAGLVELPCVSRNAAGAANAVTAANMALSGIPFRIPCDEVIDAMGAVGEAMHASLKETGQGGLAATPTGQRIAQAVLHTDPSKAKKTPRS